MVAAFMASTSLLSESWKLCRLANTTAPTGFVCKSIGEVTYVAFSSVQIVGGLLEGMLWCRNMVPIHHHDDNHDDDDTAAIASIFSALRPNADGDGEKAVAMVHAGFLSLFLSMYSSQSFQNQMYEIMKKSKSVVFTGQFIGGALASLTALWLLSHLQSISSPLSLLCVTFGSPLLGNQSLSLAILQQRWDGNFCHVVGNHDIVPRLLFAPLAPITEQLHSLLQYYQQFSAIQLPDEKIAKLFLFVLPYVETAAKTEVKDSAKCSFWPFGSYMFCTNEGAVCADNAMVVVKLLYFMFATASPRSSIEDHLDYENYIGKVSMLSERRGLTVGELPESSYEVGIALALQSSGIANHEPVSEPVKDCLKLAKRMGRTPNLNSANLAIGLSKITPLRAQIEWYKAFCDESDDQLGYYDSFKLRGASKRDFKVNMNRIKLAQFWNDLIRMLETNQLPYDFHKRAKWVNASQFYKLLVEPLDIAEYYRSGMYHKKGHYMKHGREKRYEVFDRWWKETRVGKEENNERTKFSSLTQDSCFWARVEEAREWLDKVRSESDPGKLCVFWENIDMFEQYARRMVERKEISRDVVARNSSYSLWVEEWMELKSQLHKLPP